jgi:GNAT superfamily N-acetyltransferase
MNIRSLHNGEQDACLDLWDVAFAETSRVHFEKYFQEPGWHLDDTVVCEEAGQLVSAVHIVRRVVETREGRRSMAGVSNVGTHPEFRGGGRSTACLTELLRRMEADPTLDFSLLGTGIPGFYARLGWAPWKQQAWEGGNPFLEKPLPAGQARPATAQDLPQIVAWHTAHHQNQPLSVVRDEAYWRSWMGWSPEGYLVSSEGYAHVRDAQGVRIIVARTEGFPWHEAFGEAERVRICLPLTESAVRPLLLNPVSSLWGGMMIRTLHNKPLPDLTNSVYNDGDGF